MLQTVIFTNTLSQIVHITVDDYSALICKIEQSNTIVLFEISKQPLCHLLPLVIPGQRDWTEENLLFVCTEL